MLTPASLDDPSKDFDEAIRFDPNYQPAHFGRTVAHVMLNMDAQAQRDVNRIIQLGFDPLLLQVAIEDLIKRR